MTKFVAVSHDGEIEVHASTGGANYLTLCGVDGDDPGIGQRPAALPKNAKITCKECAQTIIESRRWKRTDIAAELLSRITP